MAYCTIDDVRDEGFEECDFSNRRVQKVLDRASDLIERATGRFFESRELTIDVEWRGSRDVLLEIPIIRLDRVTFVNTDGTESQDLSPFDLIVFNRHVRQGLTEPDDREDPKIAFQFIRPDVITPRPEPRLVQELLTRRTQNVRLRGRFGYTDPNFKAGRSVASGAGDAITAPDTIKMDNGAFTAEDVGRTITIAGSGAGNDGDREIASIVSADTVRTVEQDLTTEGTGFTATLSAFPQFGVTPAQIAHACMLIASKDLQPKADVDPLEAALSSGRLRGAKVRDQSIQLAQDARLDRDAGAPITGDPEVDIILAQFMRPLRIGVA